MTERFAERSRKTERFAPRPHVLPRPERCGAPERKVGRERRSGGSGTDFGDRRRSGAEGAKRTERSGVVWRQNRFQSRRSGASQPTFRGGVEQRVGLRQNVRSQGAKRSVFRRRERKTLGHTSDPIFATQNRTFCNSRPIVLCIFEINYHLYL